MARRSIVQIEFQVVRQLISSFRDRVPTCQGQRVRGVSTIRAGRAKGVAVARGLVDRNTVRSSFTRAPSGVLFSTSSLPFVSSSSFFPLFCFSYKYLPPVLLFLLHFPLPFESRSDAPMTTLDQSTEVPNDENQPLFLTSPWKLSSRVQRDGLR